MVVFGYLVEAALALLLVVIAVYVAKPQEVEELVEALRERTPSRLAEYRELRVAQRRRLAQLRTAPVYLPRQAEVFDFEKAWGEPYVDEAA